MPKSVISYDKDLPEIPGRLSWEKPSAYLVKDEASPDGWRVEEGGRRPSRLLLVEKVRTAVDLWRDQGYPGTSPVTRRLLAYWFEEEHEVPGFGVPFRYYFCQREAIETLIYVVEIAGIRDAQALIRSFAEIGQKDLFTQAILFQTTMAGQRQIRRYVPELEAEGIQDLPPTDLRRYAFKMATGSGKTWVMAMAIIWSQFHKRQVPGSDLSTNFLIVAPNVIVYQRLERDFASNRIFYDLPLIPPEWRGAWSQKVILRGESSEPDPSGNLFLTNIHQLYESRDQVWTPANAVQAILGPKPVQDLAAYQRSMLDRLKELPDLVVMNDEAHHVHDPDLAWSKSLLALQGALPRGLALWLDFSATPKDQNAMYYPWNLVDYPLAQAVEDRIVKAPLIVTQEDNHPPQDPDGITKENVVEKYEFWIRAAVERWQVHYETFKMLGIKPVLFIMVEKNAYADAIGDFLLDTKEFGFKRSEVLTIHTGSEGDILKKDLEKAREIARDIDKPDNKIKAIISVLMLKEGWDVRNVTVVLGLRPFEKPKILPEQVVGRGLRLMIGIGPDTQTLEVLGTRNLLDNLRTNLEAEGVGVGTSKGEPPRPIIIEPVMERMAYDIAIPLTKPVLTHSILKLSSLDPTALDAIFTQAELEETLRITLRMEFATTETEVHQADVMAGALPFAQEILAAITNKVMRRSNLSNAFAELYPLVRIYVSQRCFGHPVAVENDGIRSHLRNPMLQEGIARFLAKQISRLTVERRALEFENADFKLSDTIAFRWQRNLEPAPLQCAKTIFNFVATYNNFERRFAEFLDKAPDVRRFASLGTTEQGDSGARFRVDYLKPSGATGFYHPDWVAVQQVEGGEISWIIETKGRVWEGTADKDNAMEEWCKRIREQTGQRWRFARVNQGAFEQVNPTTLAEAVRFSDKSKYPLI